MSKNRRSITKYFGRTAVLLMLVAVSLTFVAVGSNAAGLSLVGSVKEFLGLQPKLELASTSVVSGPNATEPAAFFDLDAASAYQSGTTFTGSCANPGFALADDSDEALCDDNENVVASGFSLDGLLPSAATGIGFTVEVRGRVTNDDDTDLWDVALSWDGGSNFSSTVPSGSVNESEGNDFAPNSGCSTFGRTWTATELSNANFRARVTANPSTGSDDMEIDRIRVRVCYNETIINQASVAGALYAVASPSASLPVAVEITHSSGTETNTAADDWKATEYQIEGQAAVCVNHADENAPGTDDVNFLVTTPATNGIYDITFTTFDNDTCTPNALTSDPFTLTDAIEVGIFGDSFGIDHVETYTANGWIDPAGSGHECEVEDGNDVPGIITRNAYLRVSDCASGLTQIRPNISTVGFTGVVLRYKWAAKTNDDGTDDGDLRVQWKPSSSSTWIDVNTHDLPDDTDGDVVNQVTANLPAGADNTSIDIRFWTTGNSEDRAHVDDVIITVQPAPTAVDDTAKVLEDAAATAVSVLANDTGSPGTIASVTQPTNGDVVITGGGTGLTYQPDANYCNDGSPLDTFTYTLAPGGSQASVSMTVNCVNDLPVANNDGAKVSEDAPATAVTVLGNDTDVESDPITITAVTQPTNGDVVITGGGTGLTYQPDANYCNGGSPFDTFTYTINGGAQATVSMTVNCVNDPPVANNDGAKVSEDAPATAVTVLGNDTDVESDPITITAVTQPTNGDVVITGGGTGLTYQPDANYCNGGSPFDTFTYTINGGAQATVSMTVNCVNDPPVANNDPAKVLEDASPTPIPVLGNDTDVESDPITITAVTQPTNGDVVITGGGTGLTYQPDANYCNNPPGTTPDTFTYTINGGSTATVSVIVNCQDDNPTAVNDAAKVSEDAAATAVTVLGNDQNLDGGPMTISSASDPANGTVVLTGGTAGAHTGLTYQPDPNYCNAPPGSAPDTFTYTLNGGSTATVSMTVNCVLDADVSITKTDGVTTATPGGAPVVYLIVVSNAGPDTATGVAVTDTFPAGLTGCTFTASQSGGATGFLAAGSGNISDDGITLPAGASVSYSVTCNILPNATGIISNTASVTSGVFDPNPANDEATDTDTLTPQTNLSVSKTDGETTSIPGTQIIYTIVASNAGPSTAPNVTVTDTYPAGLTSCSYISTASAGVTGHDPGLTAGGGINDSDITLPPNTAVTYTVTCTIDPSATGTLTNAVTVPTPVTDPTPANNSATDTNQLTPVADVSVTKTDNTGTASPGGTAIYTIVASNAGPSTATDVTVTDTFPATLTGCSTISVPEGGAIGNDPGPFAGDINDTGITLPVGSKVTYTVTCTIDPRATGTLTNDASISSPVADPANDNDDDATDTTVLAPLPQDLSITKTDGVATAIPGQGVTYTIVATNHGPGTATGVTVTDTFAAPLFGCSSTSVAGAGVTGNDPGPTAGNLNDSGINIPAGETVTYTVTCSIDAAATGTLSNTATVAGPLNDPTPGNNTATDNNTVLVPTANIFIGKTDSPDAKVAAGEKITYTITVGNKGPSVATNVVALDTLPPNVTFSQFVSITQGTVVHNPAPAPGVITANFGTLAPGATATLIFEVIVNASKQHGATIANTATVTSNAADPDILNNSATATITVNNTADVSITKTDGATVSTPGSTVTYTTVASNAGPAIAVNVRVVDVFPPTLSGCSTTSAAEGGAAGNDTLITGNIDDLGITLPVGSKVTYTSTCNIDAGATGSISNTATISTTVPDPTPANNTATDVNTLGPTADLSITKTDGVGVTTETPGTSITYTIVASNAGPSIATGVVVADTFPSSLTGCLTTSVAAGGATGNDPGQFAGNINDFGITMPVGSSVTYTSTCTINAGATGTLSNTATVASPNVTDPVTGNNSATDSDNLVPSHDLSIVKTDGLTNATPGQTTPVYTIVVLNAGPSVATGVTVTDNFPSGLTGCTTTSVAAGSATGNVAGPVAGNIAAGGITLPVGGSVTYTATCIIGPSATGTVSNTATVSNSGDPNTANNTSTDNTTLVPSANVSITKTDGVLTVSPGGSVTYTIVVSNSGPSTATGVTVSDTFPASLSGCLTTSSAAGGATGNVAGPVAGNIAAAGITLPVGGSVTFTSTCTVSGSATGTLSNTAFVTGAVSAAASATDANTAILQLQTATITNTPVVYNGNQQTATVTCSGGGAATLATGGTGTNAGSYPATVNCAASATHAAGTGLVPTNNPFVIQKAPTSTVITNIAALGSNLSGVGQPYAVNWTVSVGGASASEAERAEISDAVVITGTVTVSDGAGGTNTCPVQDGTCQLTSPTPGVKSITATYSGDNNLLPSNSSAQSVPHTVAILISGNIRRFVNGGPNVNLAGVTVTLSGSVNSTATTDANGNYVFAVLASGGSFVITPAGFALFYDPTSRMYTNVTTSITDANFLGYPKDGPDILPRNVRVINSVATAGTAVTVPIESTALGGEQRYEFTLQIDSAVLGTPVVTCGAATVGCTIVHNTTQVGKVGVRISNFGALAPGARQIARVTFPTAAGPPASTMIGFGDVPVARNIRNTDNNPVPAMWRTGFVSFLTNTEADVVGSEGSTVGGDGIRANDVSMIRQMALRLVTADPSNNQYQRADVGPRDPATGIYGDGETNVADVIVARQYALGMLPPTAAAGPNGPVTVPAELRPVDGEKRSLRIGQSSVGSDGLITVPVEFDSTGDEAGLSFSVDWDPTMFRLVETMAGKGVPEGAHLGTNSSSVERGTLGVLIDAEGSYEAGNRQVMLLVFEPVSGAHSGDYPISLTDTIVPRYVSSLGGDQLFSTFIEGKIVVGSGRNR